MTLAEELSRTCISSKNISSEPGDILNTLSNALEQAIWLLSEDFSVVWYSEYSYKLTSSVGGFRGFSSHRIMPDLLNVIEQLADREHLSISKGTYNYQNIELDVTVVPIAGKCSPAGYIITLGKSPGSVITGLLEKQKKRAQIYGEPRCS